MRFFSWLVVLIPMVLSVESTLAIQLNLPVQKIVPPQARASDLWFGNQVDVDGGYLVTGGPTSGNRGGRAYLYESGNAGWEYLTDFRGPVNDSNYFYFGRNAVVSSGSSDAPPRVLVSSAGGGIVFEESKGSWVETSLLPGFGAIDGNTAVSVIADPKAVVSRFENGSWSKNKP